LHIAATTTDCSKVDPNHGWFIRLSLPGLNWELSAWHTLRAIKVRCLWAAVR